MIYKAENAEPQHAESSVLHSCVRKKIVDTSIRLKETYHDNFQMVKHFKLFNVEICFVK